MVMQTLQIRMDKKMIKYLDSLIKTGIYHNRSEAIRAGVRKTILDSLVGIIPNTGDSVKEVREIRKKLSKERINLKEINNLK